MGWKCALALGIGLVLLSACEAPTAHLEDQPEEIPDHSIVEGRVTPAVLAAGKQRYIVRFSRSEPNYLSRRDVVLREHDGFLEYQIKGVFGGKGFIAWFTPEQAIRLRTAPGVMYVEEDQMGYPASTRSLSTQAEWGLDRVDQRAGESSLDDTYTYFFDGSGVHVYIIDTGIDTLQGEFSGRIGNGTGTSMVDGDGYHSCGPYGDWSRHGTAVAGVAAGTNYGIATDATVHSARLTCRDSSSTALIVQAIDWVEQNHTDPAVANLSWVSTSTSVRDAINDLYDAGVLVTTGAGNDTTSASTWGSNTGYGAFVIAASDSLDELAGFSNYGSVVDLIAPGEHILTADTGSSSNGRNASGTSFAAPFVAGAAALLLDQDSYLTPSEIRTVLTESSTQDKLDSSTLNGSPNKLLYSLHLWMDASGEEEVVEEGNHTYSMTDPVGGSGSFTYQWKYKTGGGEWSVVGTSSSYTRNIQENDPDFDLKAVISSGGGTFSRDFDVKLCWNNANIHCEADE